MPQKIKRPQLDWDSLQNNIKSATNPAALFPINGENNFTTTPINVTVESACKALVTVFMGVSSTSDFEFQTRILVNGTAVQTSAPQAAAGNTSGRATTRGMTAVVNLAAGANTITAGTIHGSGANISIATSGLTISALIMGNVTA